MTEEVVRRTIAAFAWARSNNLAPTKITSTKSGTTIYLSDSGLSENKLRYYDPHAAAICFANITPSQFYIDVGSYSSGAHLRMSGNYGSADDRVNNKQYVSVEVFSGNKVLVRFSDLDEHLYEIY